MEKKIESLPSNDVLKQNLLLQVSRKTTKRLSKNQATNQNGITLIALVVTIVVLLILAGITISLVFGENGVIKRAQDSKEQTAIGEMRDKLEMAKLPVFTEGNGSYNVQDYWDRIESEGLIADQSTDKIDNGDGTYEITTTPGYVFEITVEPNEEIADNIIIGDCIGKGENLKIGVRVVNKTTNSIEVELVRAEGASNLKYSIKKQGEEYGAAQASDSTTYTFNGLTQGAIYTIKVEATKDGEQQEVERTVQVGEIPRAIYGEVTWTGNGQASVRIYTNEEGYQLEWQKNGISEGSWTRENAGVKEITIQSLSNGDNIYARLYDGVSSGDWANIEVADDVKPQEATIIPSTTEGIKLGESLTVRVTHIDNESGVNAKSCKWELNNSNIPIGIEEGSYSNYFTNNGQQLTITPTTMGDNYLHVLTVDNAGNKKETVSNAIFVNIEVNRGNGGNIDIKFLNTSNNIISSVPTPKLGIGMTAIKWDEASSQWIDTTTSDQEWYSYTTTEKKWANARTEDGSMWVWIPRYAYKIEYLATDGQTVIGYSDSRGIVDVSGNIVEETQKEESVSIGDNYVVHPAFSYFEDNRAISGIWVAKFEASKNGSTIQVKPGVRSYEESVNITFNACRNYNTELNSHMMKNSEWGACAYLAESEYGKNEEIWINNNSSYITGSAGNSASATTDTGTTTDYTSTQGQEASTTGNIYGIYDMNGGAREYVAAYLNDGNTNLTTYGSSLINAPIYMKDIYEVGSENTSDSNYAANSKVYGDAVYETSSGYNDYKSWYEDTSVFLNTQGSVFIRGGQYKDGAHAGIFSFRTAGAAGDYGFRPVLVLT